MLRVLLTLLFAIVCFAALATPPFARQIIALLFPLRRGRVAGSVARIVFVSWFTAASAFLLDALTGTPIAPGRALFGFGIGVVFLMALALISHAIVRKERRDRDASTAAR